MIVLQIKRSHRNLQLALTMIPWPHSNREQLFVDSSDLVELLESIPPRVVFLWRCVFVSLGPEHQEHRLVWEIFLKSNIRLLSSLCILTLQSPSCLFWRRSASRLGWYAERSFHGHVPQAWTSHRSPGELVKMRILVRLVWREAWESACLTSF